MRRTPFASIIFISFIIITGAIISIGVSLTETKAFSDKTAQKQINEKDDAQKNYQQMYKQYDFAKYLNYYYTYSNEYNQNYDSHNGVDNSEKNPFDSAFHNFNGKNDDDNNKKQQQQSNRHSDDSKVKYVLERDRKDIVENKKDSSDKNEKQTYKNLKIIECRNFNINAYELEDLKGVKALLSKPSVVENENGNQQGKDHSSEISKEAREYNIGSNTKVIFICNNERYSLSPLDSNNVIHSIPSNGIIIPTNSQNNNNDDDNDAK